MHVSELRIGNWVYSHEIGGYVQISSISEEAIHFKDCVTWDYPTCEEIVPIKLTEEILLKCGFDLINNEFYRSRNSELCLYWTVNKNKMIPEYNGKRLVTGYDFKHVHHLQNLYFALTGEELTVNL